MTISICLSFDGNCREAFDHYQSVFSAVEICRQTFSDGPPEIFADEPGEQIMHTSIQIGETVLMGSDRGRSQEAPYLAGNNFAVSYRPSSKNEADLLFPKLADGGKITLPLHETFWGSYYGLCTDRFGVNWMFNCPLAGNPIESKDG